MQKIYRTLFSLGALGVICSLFCIPPAFAAQAEYVEGEVIVVMEAPTASKGTAAFASGVEGKVSSLASAVNATSTFTAKAMAESTGRIITHLKSATMTTEELIGVVSGQPGVLSVTPNYRVKISATPDDTYFGDQWAHESMRSEQAWNLTTGSDDIYVLVIDTGIKTDHPDLAANVGTDNDGNHGINVLEGAADSADITDDNGHGTHVAGIIGAVGNNGTGIAGVAWNVKLLGAKALDSAGEGDSAKVMEALDYALDQKQNGLDGLKVVNLSLGGWAPEVADVPTDPYFLAFKALADKGIVIVMAAGNEAQDIDSPGGPGSDPSDPEFDYTGKLPYPAALAKELDTGICVASITGDEVLDTTSNYGVTYAHLAAPGADILSLGHDVTPYVTMSGTSMATPQVAGAAALLFAQDGAVSGTAVRDRIVNNARELEALAGKCISGGTLDIAAAVGEGLNADTGFLSFSVPGQVGDAVIDSETGQVTLRVPFDLLERDLVATFTLSEGATAYVDGVEQESGVTENDFTDPVTYTVRAENGDEQEWVVEVVNLAEPLSGNDMLHIEFTTETVGTFIEEETHTFTVVLPYYVTSEDLTSLVALFSLSEGATAYVGSVEQESGVTENDFTDPVTYTVRAENGDEQEWIVSVEVLEDPRTGTDIVGFSVPGLVSPAAISPSAHTIRGTLPVGSSRESLVATFNLSSGATAYVGGTLQESGVTANNFTSPVTYTVVAEDESEQAWVVTLSVQSPAPAPDPEEPDPVDPVDPVDEPVAKEKVAPLIPGRIRSDSGVSLLSAEETTDLVNANEDVKRWVKDEDAVLLGAFTMDETKSDFSLDLNSDNASRTDRIEVEYRGARTITPMFVQGKKDGNIDRFDLSLPARQISSLMAQGEVAELTFRIGLRSQDTVIMINGRNLVAEGLAVVKEASDGTFYLEMTFSNVPGSRLTFSELGGTLVRVMSHQTMEVEILALICSNRYVYQDLVNLAIERLDSSKWLEYRSAINRFVSEQSESVKITVSDIQREVDAVNRGGASSSGGGGCSVGFTPGMLLLLTPAILLKGKK